MPPKVVTKCGNCKWCAVGPWGYECHYDPPADVTMLHPHPWPLVNPDNEIVCHAAEAN